MRVAVTGITGRLGGALVGALEEAPFTGPMGPLPWSRRDLDLDTLSDASVGALIDRASPAFASQGMRHATASDERWLDKLSEEPLMLRMPLVRQIGLGAKGLTIGLAEEEWRLWIAT